MIRFVDGKLDPTSLTKNQRLIVDVIRARGPQTVTELSEAIDVDYHTARRALDTLYARRVLERGELKLNDAHLHRVWHISPSVL